MNSNRGFALIEVIVAGAIMMIIVLGVAQMMEGQARQSRGLSEHLGVLAAKNEVTGLLANGAVCLYEVNNPSIKTFDSSSAAAAAASVINLSQIHIGSTPGAPVALQVGQLASPDTNTLFVQSIQVTNFVGSGTSWTADWVIKFDNTKTLIALQPIRQTVSLQVDTTTPSAAKVTGCNTTGTSASIASTTTIYPFGNGSGTHIVGCHSFCALGNTHDCNGCGYAVDPVAGACPAGKQVWRVTQFTGSMNVNCIDF